MLQITGNYYAAYSAEKTNSEQHRRAILNGERVSLELQVAEAGVQ